MTGMATPFFWRTTFVAMIAAIGAVPQAGMAQPSSANPPVMGLCRSGDGDSLLLPKSVSWTYDAESGRGEAEVIDSYGDKYAGTVEGMRRHNDWFKFSIFFEDKYEGTSELTIFYAIDAFRIGIVAFDVVAGEKYVSSATGFGSVDCVVQ